MKKLAILFALTLCVALAGCNQPAPPQGGELSEPQETPEVEVIITEPEEPTPPTDEQTATLYIGTKAGGFNEYPMAYEGELTPEKLIQGIADLTGWNLTLAEDVISGKGGMSVCLSSESALFTGPPDPQREEFFVFGLDDLAETLLDSIQKTLQMGFTGEDGNPDALDIWYYMEGDQPLELPALGLSWPIDQPYQRVGAETE
ncbi:hypothetical protein AALC17_20485 [Oscillospiraceae bacterium 38-13]